MGMVMSCDDKCFVKPCMMSYRTSGISGTSHGAQNLKYFDGLKVSALHPPVRKLFFRGASFGGQNILPRGLCDKKYRPVEILH